MMPVYIHNHTDPEQTFSESFPDNGMMSTGIAILSAGGFMNSAPGPKLITPAHAGSTGADAPIVRLT